MKTITEWFDEGITKLRLPKWNEWAYLEVKGKPGALEPFVYLFDIGCNGEPILIFDLLSEQFEQWTPPEDYDTRKDEIYELDLSIREINNTSDKRDYHP